MRTEHVIFPNKFRFSGKPTTVYRRGFIKIVNYLKF